MRDRRRKTRKRILSVSQWTPLRFFRSFCSTRLASRQPRHEAIFETGFSLPTVALLLLLGTVASSGCGVIRKRPEDKPSQLALVGKEMSNQEAKQVLSELGRNFAYGPGLGDAALNIGVAVAFPPYALYLLGNAVLSVSGYEPVTVSAMLPEEQGKRWSDGYDSIVSGPGKVVAALAGDEYRSREVGEQKMAAVISAINNSPDKGKDPTPDK